MYLSTNLDAAVEAEAPQTDRRYVGGNDLDLGEPQEVAQIFPQLHREILGTVIL